MNLPITLPAEAPEHPAMDYAFLRSEGIRILERLGGQLWTDFNAHDPGITILEQVCYAITDLAYRINYDMKDLLASGENDPYRSLHSPAQVLTTNPVTLTDLRKLVIDVPGVKNAWFELVEKAETGLKYDPFENTLFLETTSPQPPHREPVPLRGIYRVLIEGDRNLTSDGTGTLQEVNHRLQACRNLGEDFLFPIMLPGQPIIVNAEIEVGAVDDPEHLLAEIYFALASFISPRFHFYTLTEMLQRGKRIDEIMNGPALQHGFIDDAELEQLERKVGLRTSDLIQEILNIEGTVTVGSIAISDGSKPKDENKPQSWYLKLDPLSTPFLDVESSLFDANGPTIRLTRGGIAVQPKPERVSDMLSLLQQSGGDHPLPESQLDILLQTGHDRNIGRYHSIQHQFPAAYGIGSIGLPESASPQRKAQAKQLKAYLMFFDQLLANYFAQLANAKDLFSFYALQPHTYFSQVINDDSLNLEEILGNDQVTHAARVQTITEASALGVETIDPENPISSGRKNRFLNHLLARFAEQFTDYSLLLYAHIGEQDLIEDKSAFLQDYHEIGTARGSGFNYTEPSWGSKNVSGLEKRISRKLGISNDVKRDLATADANDEGGFHMLEHVLLRPNQADEEQWAQAVAGTGWQAAAFMAQPISNDPYSHQLSFIFPKWFERFSDRGFSDLIEKTLRTETPAHIRVYLHWLDEPEMLAFESAYKDWMENVIAGRLWYPMDIQPNDDVNWMIRIKLRDARDRMVLVLGLGTPYPLRDLKLVYPAIIAYNRPASIQILGGQSGVLYQLCDEDGNPYIENGTSFEVLPETGTPADGIFLTTPAIRRDITFTILAVRANKEKTIRLETYLNQQVSMQAGIDTSLPVAFKAAEEQVAEGYQITVNYSDKVSVEVSGTQEGISYKLVNVLKDDTLSDLSNPVKGNQGKITLVSKIGVGEDTTIKILAYRTASSKISALLETALSIHVRPNPAVAINVQPPIIDYQSSARLTLVSPQSSVEYTLFKRELVTSEYQSSEADSLVIQTDESRRVPIKTPEKITDWNEPAGFVLVDVFNEREGNVSADTGSLLEDTLFIVQATKIENRERLQLDQVIAILVRPNPAPTVGVLQGVVESGTTGTVKVDGTQKGVAYQLRLDENNQPVNPPGYHLTDRGIETIRVEVDMIVEDQGKPILLLPTGPITGTTSFNILASKILTGVSAPLNEKATLDVPPATPPETSDSGSSGGS